MMFKNVSSGASDVSEFWIKKLTKTFYSQCFVTYGLLLLLDQCDQIKIAKSL